MKVTIITAGYNSAKHVKPFFESVTQTKGVEYEIVAINDGSTDESTKEFEAFEGRKNINIIQLKKNVGGSAARNRAAFTGTGEYIVYFDIDARIEPDTVARLLEPHVKDHSIGITQAVLLNADGTIETSGHFLTPFGFPYNIATDYRGQKDRVPTLGTRVAFMISRELFTKIGGYDEDYKIYAEDTDITWRVWLTGKEVYTYPDIRVFHLKQSSLSKKTNFRVYYEGSKNQINSLIKNLPFSMMVWMLPLHIAVWLAISLKLLIAGKADMSLWIYRGIWWNMSHVRWTFKKRKTVLSYTKKPLSYEQLFGPLTLRTFFLKGLAWIRGF